jgi:hypothetical protein
MKNTFLVLISIFALVSTAAFAECIKGRITTSTEGGAVLVDTNNNPIGSIPNPVGLTPEETGYFSYSYIPNSNQEEITLIENVVKVKSCRGL